MVTRPVLNPQEKCPYCFSYFPVAKIARHKEICPLRPDDK